MGVVHPGGGGEDNTLNWIHPEEGSTAIFIPGEAS